MVSPPAQAGQKATATKDQSPDVLLTRRSARLRARAAWMYYVEEMTQNAIAKALGIGRVTVVRLLADARSLNEVKITLNRETADLSQLEFALQRAFGLEEAIIVPLSSPGADPTGPIAAGAGQCVSGLLLPDMKVGVGWGKTLLRMLSFIAERHIPNLSVVSLLGGIIKANQYNPSEFAWQFSRLFQAECYLIPAPAIVDSVETKQALVDRCGLAELFELAKSLDCVLLSVGSMAPTGTTFRFGYISAQDRRTLIAKGAVGDVLYNFFDLRGLIDARPYEFRHC